MNEIIKNNGIKFGLIISSISILYSMSAYLFDEELFANFWMGAIILISFFALMLVSVVSTKNQLGGYITFKEAFSAFAFTGIVNIAITLMFNILLFHVIDTELAGRIVELTVEKTGEMMEKFGTPDEAIDEALDGIREGDNYAIGSLFKGSLYSIIFIAILGAVVAAFMKRPKPIFQETLSED